MLFLRAPRLIPRHRRRQWTALQRHPNSRHAPTLLNYYQTMPAGLYGYGGHAASRPALVQIVERRAPR